MNEERLRKDIEWLSVSSNFHTITDDHAGLQGLISECLIADATRPLVDIEEAAHTVARPMEVV